jgi:hypothetical protein
VRPSDETRAREIVREIVEGAPPNWIHRNWGFG